MIASLSQIVYIAFVKSEPVNEKIIQKGKAISKLDNAGTFQTFQFCQYLPISDTNSDDSDFDDNGEALQELKQDFYHITGKFALVEDDIIDIIITTSKRLKLDADAISIGQPLVHLLGRIMQLPSINETGYTLPFKSNRI